MLDRAKSYLSGVRDTVFGLRPAGRALSVFSNDIFLVSYFRSGSTWSRFLFGNFIHDEPAITFSNMNRFVPSIYETPDRILRRLPRIMKSHECFDPQYPRVLYIVRDPRDVAVSFYYYYNLKTRVIPEGYPMDDFIPRFVTAQIVDYADRVGSWQDHVLSWIRLRQDTANFCLIRYEQSAAVLRRACVHWRKKNRNIGRRPRNTRQDIPFVREAKSGGWRTKLSPAAVEQIEQAWGGTMEELGYQLTTAAAVAHPGHS